MILRILLESILPAFFASLHSCTHKESDGLVGLATASVPMGEKKEKKDEKSEEETEFEVGALYRPELLSTFLTFSSLAVLHVALVSERTLQQVEVGDFVKVKQILDEAVVKAVRL